MAGSWGIQRSLFLACPLIWAEINKGFTLSANILSVQIQETLSSYEGRIREAKIGRCPQNLSLSASPKAIPQAPFLPGTPS